MPLNYLLFSPVLLLFVQHQFHPFSQQLHPVFVQSALFQPLVVLEKFQPVVPEQFLALVPELVLGQFLPVVLEQILAPVSGLVLGHFLPVVLE